MSGSIDKIRTSSYQLPVENDEIALSNSQLENCRVMFDALVLDARLRQSLVTVRSLGRHGLRVAALGNSAVSTFSSRWCQQAFVCPVNEGEEAYLDHLEQLLDQYRVRVLMMSSDATIALIRQHRERLEQRVRIALAGEPALGIAINKEHTLQIAQQLGIGVPRAVSVRGADEVRAALREIGLPAVVKPVESWSWSGQQGARIVSQLVTTAEEAQRAVEELTRFGGTILFQEFLSGKREALSFFYANGKMYARFAQWAKRTQPPLGGTSVYRQSIAIPDDIGDQAERLVREIDLEGYSEVEFRRDSAGKAYLMEINPRLSASVEVAVRAGVDFPYHFYQWASGEQINRVESYRVGGRMRYLSGDIGTTVEAVRQRSKPGVAPPARAILDFCVSFFIPTGYDFLDWKDPLPAWKATKGFFAHHLPRLARRILSRRKSRCTV